MHFKIAYVIYLYVQSCFTLSWTTLCHVVELLFNTFSKFNTLYFSFLFCETFIHVDNYLNHIHLPLFLCSSYCSFHLRSKSSLNFISPFSFLLYARESNWFLCPCVCCHPLGRRWVTFSHTPEKNDSFPSNH